MSSAKPLTITNGRITWFDCHVDGRMLHFGARVNQHFDITSERGSVALDDSMQVLDRQKADTIMLKAIQRTRHTPDRLALLFAVGRLDMTDMCAFARSCVRLPGVEVQRSTMVTRTGRRVEVEPTVWETMEPVA